MDLVRAAAMDLRDWSDGGKTPHVKYPLQEKLAKLKKGLRYLTMILAREKSHLVRKTANISAGVSGAVLPTDYMATFEVYLPGRENEGPLPLVSRESRFDISLNPPGYYLEGGRLHLAPAPAGDTGLTLVYGAWPALVLAVVPGDDAAAESQLNDDLPWNGLFDEALQQFVVFACLNRNEYDTNIEQGLLKMLTESGQDVAALDDLGGLERSGPGGLWAGVA